VYDAGFGSSSRVYERVDTKLGMTPKQYRAGGMGVAISYAAVNTPLGLILIGATDQGSVLPGVRSLGVGAMLDSLRNEYPAAHLSPLSKPYSEQYLNWVEALSSYLEGERALGKLPVSLHGTAFQVKVWNYLQTIPNGSVQSYSEVAEGHWTPQGDARRRVSLRCQPHRTRCAMPSSNPRRWRTRRLPLGLGPKARPARHGTQSPGARKLRKEGGGR
jgi:AraC family transcriptional regulator of adaptative response/methylated-DNA-[protein]-cysteine methyltransferase